MREANVTRSHGTLVRLPYQLLLGPSPPLLRVETRRAKPRARIRVVGTPARFLCGGYRLRARRTECAASPPPPGRTRWQHRNQLLGGVVDDLQPMTSDPDQPRTEDGGVS